MVLMPSINLWLALQLRHHGGWVPVTPHCLNSSILADLKDIDAFEDDLSSVYAGAAAGELHRDPVAGQEDMIFRQINCLEGCENPYEKLA